MDTVKPPMQQDAPEKAAVSTPRDVRAETTMAETAPLEGAGGRKRGEKAGAVLARAQMGPQLCRAVGLLISGGANGGTSVQPG